MLSVFIYAVYVGNTNVTPFLQNVSITFKKNLYVFLTVKF